MLTADFSALEFSGAKVRYFPYRTARLTGVVASLRLIDSRELLQAVGQLKDLAGERGGTENHVVFLISFPDGKEVSVGFSDYQISFGTGVHEGRW